MVKTFLCNGCNQTVTGDELDGVCPYCGSEELELIDGSDIPQGIIGGEVDQLLDWGDEDIWGVMATGGASPDRAKGVEQNGRQDD